MESKLTLQSRQIRKSYVYTAHVYAAEPRRRRRSKMAVAELIKRRAKRRRRRASPALNRLGV